jgi:hypothetical protein
MALLAEDGRSPLAIVGRSAPPKKIAGEVSSDTSSVSAGA